MASDFNPNGVPEILATILQRLNQQDITARETRDEIKQRIEDTKRDLGERLSAVKENLGGRIDELKTKVDMTNGKVLRHEVITSDLPGIREDLASAKKELEKGKLWRAGITGKVAGISTAVGTVVAMIAWGVDAWVMHGSK